MSTRPRLLDAPAEVVAALGAALGSAVAREVPAAAGFTPAVASVVALADGREVFVKASDDPGLHEGLRNAVDCDAALTDRSLAPPVLASLACGAWRVVAWARLPGGHVGRWSSRDVPAVLDLAARLAAATRPCRVPGTVPFPHAFAGRIGTFQALVSGGRPGPEVDHLAGTPVWSGLDPVRLAALEAGWPLLAEGGHRRHGHLHHGHLHHGHLHHGDVRRDNLIRGTDGRLRLLDWTHRWTAPGWADLVLLMPDLIRDGLDPEPILAASVWAGAPAHEVNVLLTGLLGYWFNAGHRPDLPHAPGLRALQRAQGSACASWLATRLSR
ncbi:aminoglycoside phosphotransferase [Actinoplanes philippinensis]|nr:aminoglycoside phosphotransferase [Actinoplanes philippinensis]